MRCALAACWTFVQKALSFLGSLFPRVAKAMLCALDTTDCDSDAPRILDDFDSASDCPKTTPRLRGLRWRVLLGVLPVYPAPITALRRAAANGRRRYAQLRRSLLVDPHAIDRVLRDGDLRTDDPLSQEPESIWKRYFRNTEIEKLIESDISRLYSEQGSFFQNSSCGEMLKRILLVWALIYPAYGYRQGMHEVLSPLVYALYTDVTYVAQVRQRYGDPFDSSFCTSEESHFHEKQTAACFSEHSALLTAVDHIMRDHEDWFGKIHPEDAPLLEPDDFGFNLKTVILGSDSYGAEGELGTLLSGRFLEHDAFCMFDALMQGPVRLADFFTTVDERELAAGGPSLVLEISNAMFGALATVDMPLYLHLVGLGVEPQFFTLRWLRVLFAREFDLDKLLLLWDEIFTSASTSSSGDFEREKCLPHDFVSCFAVSMLLHLRLVLLAATDATSCLQKLLNFPKNTDIQTLVQRAKVLLSFLVGKLPSQSCAHLVDLGRRQYRKFGSSWTPFQPFMPTPTVGPEMPRFSVSESYWEERWIESISFPEETLGMQPLDISGKCDVAIGGDEAQECDTSGDTSRDDNRSVGIREAGIDGGCARGNLLPSTLENKVEVTSAGIESCSASLQRDCDNESSEINLRYSSIDAGCVEAKDCREVVSLRDEETYRYFDHFASAESFKPLNDQPILISMAAPSNTLEKIRMQEDAVNRTRADAKGALQTLGHSMVESIQALENAFMQNSSLIKEGLLRDQSEFLSKSLLNGKGRMSVLSAIAELRKVSNMLVQM